MEALDEHAPDELGNTRRRIDRQAPEIDARNVRLPGSPGRPSLREKASYVYTRLVTGIVPNDCHCAGCKHGRRTFASRREGETSKRGAETETSRSWT